MTLVESHDQARMILDCLLDRAAMNPVDAHELAAVLGMSFECFVYDRVCLLQFAKGRIHT